MKKYRRQRKGEFVCRCKSYEFPHRMFGGRCTGIRWVRRFWQEFPHGEHCNQCHCYRVGECEVDSGVESVKQAECLLDFVANEEVKTYWRK